MNMTLKVDTAVITPVNIFPLTDDTDFKTRETGVAYNAAGMALVWNFVTTAGVQSQTAVTPTTAGVYDWVHLGGGMYSMEIPASGGASANNSVKGYGWWTGYATGVLPWRGPIITFAPAIIVDALVAGTDLLDVSLTQIDGQATSGNNATLNLKQLNIVNSAGSAIIATGSGASGHGLFITAGSTTANGIKVVGGSSTGDGIAITTTSGDGISSAGGTAGNGISATGAGAGNGLIVTGGNSATTAGFKATGAAAGAHGIYTLGNTAGSGVFFQGGNGNTTGGMKLVGGATGACGLVITGGATGVGAKISGGGTSGDGLQISATSGNAISATGGTNGNGLVATGAGSGAGFVVTAGATGTGLLVTGGATSGSAIYAAATSGAGIMAFSSSGDGITAQAITGNGIRATSNVGNAINADVSTTGIGIAATGAGVAGAGIKAVSAAAAGLHVEGGGTGAGFYGVGGTSGAGMRLIKGASATNDLLLDTPSSNLPVSATVAGTIDANLVSIDGETTDGNNATLNLKQLSIVNASGIPVDIQSGTGAGAVAVNIVSNAASGAGHAIKIAAGGDGSGMHISGLGTGHGILVTGGTGAAACGLKAVAQGSGGSSHGIAGYGGAGNGLYGVGGGMYAGASFMGGPTDGSIGLFCSHLAAYGTGAQFYGVTDGFVVGGSRGMWITGYKGLQIDGGSVLTGSYNNRDALKLVGADASLFGGDENGGHGLNVLGGDHSGTGTAGNGVNVESGDNATGIKVTGDEGITINGNYNGLSINSTGGDAVYINSDTNIGLAIYGHTIGAYIDGHHIGLEIDSVEEDGVKIVAGTEGISIAAQYNGVVINAQYDGIYVAASLKGIDIVGGEEGIKIDAVLDGIKVESSGGPGVSIASTSGNHDGMTVAGIGTGSGLVLTKGLGGGNFDISAGEIGQPIALDGGDASISGMLLKIADDNAGADFDAATDSLHVIAGGSSGAIIAAIEDVQTGVDSITAKLPAGDISGFEPATATVDSMTYDTIFQLMAAIADGRYRVNYPTTGDITFYKRNNSTVLTTVHVTDSERTRL